MEPSPAQYRLARAAIQLAHFRALNRFRELQNNKSMDVIIADARTLYYTRLEATHPEDMSVVASLVGQMFSNDLDSIIYHTEKFLAKGERDSFYDEVVKELRLLGFTLDTQREFIYIPPEYV